MFKSKSSIIVCLVVTWSSIAFAGGQATAFGKITRVNNNRHGWVKVSISSPNINPGKCAKTGQYLFQITNDSTKVLFSTILNAFSTQQNVSLFILDSQCDSDYPAIHGVNMKY